MENCSSYTGSQGYRYPRRRRLCEISGRLTYKRAASKHKETRYCFLGMKGILEGVITECLHLPHSGTFYIFPQTRSLALCSLSRDEGIEPAFHKAHMLRSFPRAMPCRLGYPLLVIPRWKEGATVKTQIMEPPATVYSRELPLWEKGEKHRRQLRQHSA